MEISILVVTYNHEKYVRQALDSILMQKISVSHEIIIFDDASTDKTPEILKEYKKKHPQRITLYLRKVNSGWPTKNAYFLLSKAVGRYYTFLDGDDYWIDDLRIQKQYEFLEQHKEFSGYMADFIVVDEDGNKTKKQFYDKKENNIYTLEDFRHFRSPGVTASFFARNFFDRGNDTIIFEADRIMGDITTYMLCLLHGDIYQGNEVMAVYRYVVASGKTNFNSIHQNNLYQDYMMVRYWIRQENYMRRKISGFEFALMPHEIRHIALQYPFKIGIRLMLTAENWKKYIWVYLIHKFLQDSSYLAEEGTNVSMGRVGDWDSFRKLKKPVILFGAGAVAEEYIDKYGWKENIAFLVDNDKKKQNTSFKGLLIKSPEEILHYKGRMNVLITNKDYESEIEEQLREMGVDRCWHYCTMQGRRKRNRIAKKLLKMGK